VTSGFGNSKYHNQIDDSEVNRGNAGKLNEDQLKERARKHALRLTYGRPTIQEIADSWFKEYGISMAYSSEKEWALRNEGNIQNALAQMVEEGKIEFSPFTESNLMVTLKVSGNDTGKIVKSLEKHIIDVLKSVDMDFDPMVKAGIDPDAYDAMDGEAKVKADRRIEREKLKTKLRMQALQQFGELLKEQKKLLLDTIKVANEMYSNSKIRTRQIERQVSQQVSRLVKPEISKDYGEIEITDEMRAEVLGDGTQETTE
jgi:hypothetical protein